jgi:hypothetical protein
MSSFCAIPAHRRNNPLLARANVLQGETTQAHATYQGFLTLWKDADPDMPIPIAAKSEHAKLQ